MAEDDLRAWRDATLYRLLFRASRAEMAETLARLRARGHPTATPSYTTLLSNLDTEGTTISALARRAGITRQAASQQLEVIERDGYVARHPDPNDGRAWLVRQTPKGRALLEDALAIVAELEAEYADVLGEQQLRRLKALLSDLVAHSDPGGALGRD
jgi:DNA-binding MarR family transcriptional regulator